MFRHFLSASVLVFMFCSIVPAGPALAGALENELAKLPKTVWYGVYVQGYKIGRAKEVTEISSDPEHPGYVHTVEFKSAYTSMGRTIEKDYIERMYFRSEPPYALYAGTLNNSKGDSIVLASGAGGFVADVSIGSEKQTRNLPDPEVTLADLMGQAIWIRGKPEVGDTRRYVAFTLLGPQRVEITARVDEIQETVVNGLPAKFYTVRHKPAGANIELTQTVDQSGADLKIDVGNGMQFRNEPLEIAVRNDLYTDLYAQAMVPVDKPLGDPARITGLRLEAYGFDAHKLASGPRQAVENQKVGVLVATGSGVDNKRIVDAESRKQALDSLAGLDEKTRDRVRAMAEDAVKGARTAPAKIEKLVNRVNSLLKDEPRPVNASMREILDEPYGDCTEHAELYVALANALGLPSRRVVGMYYAGDAVLAFGGHMWAETAIDGKWTEVDPALYQMSPDAAHIRLEGDMQSLLKNDLFLRVKEVENFPPDPAELEKRVRDALAGGIVETRNKVEDIYALAEIKAAAGETGEAVKLYRLGLKSDAWNVSRRLELVKHLEDSGSDEACAQAETLGGVAEDPAAVAKAAEVLAECGKEFPPRKPAPEIEGRIEIVLRPMGGADIYLIEQLADALMNEMGVLVSVDERPLSPPSSDRTNAYRYVIDVYENILKTVAEGSRGEAFRELGFTEEGPSGHEERVRFIIKALASQGPQGDPNRFLFYSNLSDFESQPQYLVDDVLAVLPEPAVSGAKTFKGLLAVTDKDLHGRDTRYLFGATSGGRGVISYFRFTAKFNNETPNRKRLLDRTLKQALSSANFLMGIERCDNPVCARAFPISLEEHDQKPATLCDVCRENLRTRIQELLAGR